MSQKTAIVTARDTDRFADATLFDVTYVGQSDMDSDVRWGYITAAVTRGSIAANIICRNRDGSGAGRRHVG